MEPPDRSAPQPSRPAPAQAPARPELRRLFVAHPDTVARQVPADNDARVRAYLAAHPDLPADIATAIQSHELWLGMTRDEVVLSVGPGTEEGDGALFYPGEGWLLRFDDQGFLRELVER